MRHLLLVILVVGCGSKTDLSVEPPVPEDAGPPPPCLIRTPEPFDVEGRVAAVGSESVWLLGLPDFAVGVADEEGGAVTVIRSGHFGLRSLAARGRTAWWAHSGWSDFAGKLVRGTVDGDVEVLHEGLFQPGGVRVDGRFVYYAEWTNSPCFGCEMRGRMLRVETGGGDVQELASGLGLPTDTALSGEHLYWVDRALGHVARVPKSGGAVEVVAEGMAMAGALGAHDGYVYYVDDLTLKRVHTSRLDVEEMAEAPTEVRGLVAAREGVLLELWYGRERVGNALAFVPSGRSDVVEVDPAGRSPTVGPRYLHWLGSRPDGEVGAMRVCREYLETL